MKPAIAVLALTLLTGCHSSCYDRETCFQADQAGRDRGVAMTAIGARLLQPQPNVYVVHRYYGY